MLNKKIMAVVGLGALVFGGAAAQAEAQSGYFGGSVAFLEYSETDIDDDASLSVLYGRLGLNFNQNFSGEIRLGVGVGDDTVDVFGTNVDVELDNMYGVYVRGGAPVSAVVYPYAVLGYTRGKATASAAGFGSVSDSETDVSFGLGVDFTVSKEITINAEYMNYLDKDGAEISGLAIGVATHF